MSFKVQPNINAIPSKLEHGHFTCNLGYTEYKIEIPVLKNFVFEEQCNQFACENVMAYLTNDTYGVILRFDSTGCLYLLKDKTFIISFTFEYEPIPILGVYPCGIYRNNVDINFVVTATKLSPDYYIISSDCPWSIVTSVVENQQYFDTPYFGEALGEPIIIERRGELYAVDISFGIKTLYKFGGRVSISSGYLALGGVR